MASILFKVSGDLIYNKEVLNEIKESINTNCCVGLIYGFGTILSDKLREKNISFSYENGIRQTTTKGLEIAQEISEDIKKFLQSKLPKVTLISPVSYLNGQIINTNADDLVLEYLKNYDAVVIYTMNGRNKDKFKDIPKIRIIEK
ncbi:MAG: hypothetical protein Q7S33_01195 [Nanoarchaeota archaeon]|nr:hypothetical protein [Nanoarchaeota archaeon]